MSGYIFAVMTVDPVTGQPASIQADLDWNIGTAAVVAESVGGTVVVAGRGPWQLVPAELVSEALEASKQQVMDAELRDMLTAGEQTEGDPR
jgi:hypothetical protein